jgi:hypothetical protein
MAVSFAQGGQVEAALNKLKDHLAANAGSIKRMFQLIDKDLSNQIDVDEFIEVLKACNIVLPPYILKGLVARFDLNGDGYISIPEFTSFMSGDSDRMEMLRDAPGAPAKPATPPPPQQSYGKMPMQQKMRAVTSEGLSRRDFVFVQRMQRDLETRRQTQFINEISTLLLACCEPAMIRIASPILLPSVPTHMCPRPPDARRKGSALSSVDARGAKHHPIPAGNARHGTYHQDP